MKIFCILQFGPQCVSNIAREIGVSLPNTSQHLRLMREQGAVDSKRAGRSVYYHLADQRFIEAANMVAEALERLEARPVKCSLSERTRLKR